VGHVGGVGHIGAVGGARYLGVGATPYHLGGYGYRGYGYGYPYYRNNYYRPYYGSGFGYGLGLGLGLYLPYYLYGGGGYYPDYGYGYGVGAFGAYSPYMGGLGMAAYPLAYGNGYGPPVAQAQAQQPSTERPPPDDAAHLQLTVPENAEVIIDGAKTTQTGTVREFVSPTLAQGTKYQYKITVRYTDAKGKLLEDTRDIRFQGNDWFSIDFTRPPPAPPAPALPLPKRIKDE
jgi:uncharacterized protein (TIGR03000 family)